MTLKQLLVGAINPWLIATSFSSLSLSSCGILLVCLCVPVSSHDIFINTYVIGFEIYPNLVLPQLYYISKTIFNKVTFIGTRG